jgi:hypothetical protein
LTSRRALPSILCAAALAAGLAACGGSDNAATTVVEQSTVTQTVTSAAPPATTGTTPATTAPSTTATTPSQPLTLHAAEQVLADRGFSTLTERDWRADQNLKVLVGVRQNAGTSDAGQQQAFFFAADRFLGTDTRDPSGRITVTAQENDAVTLTYALYRTGDSIDQPSGGERSVTYVWDGSTLTPQQTIPPASPSAPASRR